MERSRMLYRRVAAVSIALLIQTVALAGLSHAQKVTRTLWWNDPVIFEPLELGEDQRKKMDASYAEFADAISSARRTREVQNAFHEALQRGDWEDAQTRLTEWASQEENPQLAMAQLKLEVLQLLSESQRKNLVSSYPRILRRQWRPALAWTRGGKGANAKPFQGAEQQKAKKKPAEK